MGANVILLAVMAVSMFASGHAFCLASPLRHPSLPSTGHRRRLVSYEGSSVVRRVFDVADQEGPKRTSKTTLDRIDKMVNAAPIVLFMKGTKLFPSCGFSGTMVQILERMNVDFTTHDVLADDVLRQGIKEYSDWPTIPQLYLNGEFLGGTDIVLELYQSGELLEMIEVAAAS